MNILRIVDGESDKRDREGECLNIRSDLVDCKIGRRHQPGCFSISVLKDNCHCHSHTSCVTLAPYASKSSTNFLWKI